MGHGISNLALGVSQSFLCRREGVGHVFFINHISKCSGPPPLPILFDQSLIISHSIYCNTKCALPEHLIIKGSPHVRKSGFRNPANICSWNPDTSKFFLRHLESMAWNPESKTVLDFVTWSERGVNVCCNWSPGPKFHLLWHLEYTVNFLWDGHLWDRHSSVSLKEMTLLKRVK